MLYTQCPRHTIPCSEETLYRLLRAFSLVTCPECNDEVYVLFKNTRIHEAQFHRTLAMLVGGNISSQKG